MPRVPQHQLTSSLGAPGTAEGIGSTMLNSVKAAAGFTGDLLEAGDSVVKVFEKQQKLANEKTILDAKLGMQTRLADLQGELQTLPASQWVERFDEAAQEYKQEFLKQDYPEQVRKTLELEANALFGRGRIAVGKSAMERNLADVRAAKGNEIKHHAARGEFDPATTKLGEMHSAGLIGENDYKVQSQELDALRSIHGFKEAIARDPYKAGAAIDSPDFLAKNPALTLADQEELSRLATRTENKNKEEFWSAAVDAANNPTHPKILSPEELEKLAEAGKISQTDRARYLETYHQPGAHQPNPAIYEDALSYIRAYDPEDDPDGFGLANLRAAIATYPLPKEHLQELSKQLTGHLESFEQGPEAKIARDVQKNFSDLTGKYFDAGRFGGWFRYGDHDDNPNTAETKITDLDAYNKAAAQMAKFSRKWEAYLKDKGPDLDPIKAGEDFDGMFQSFLLEQKPTPFSDPDLPPAIDYDAEVTPLIESGPDAKGAEGAAGPKGAKGGGGGTYNLKFSSYQGRKKLHQSGGSAILLDTNWSAAKGGIASPLVVIPNNHTATQRKQAQAYADKIAEALNQRLGRNMKGQVKTKAENGRGRDYAFHTEPYALTDPGAVRFMTSPEGMRLHREILQNTLGRLPNANFFLPHSSSDPGATVNGRSEVQTARELLRGFDTNLPPTALTAPREQAERIWFDYAQPTSPAEIRAGLDELANLRTLSQYG